MEIHWLEVIVQYSQFRSGVGSLIFWCPFIPCLRGPGSGQSGLYPTSSDLLFATAGSSTFTMQVQRIYLRRKWRTCCVFIPTSLVAWSRATRQSLTGEDDRAKAHRQPQSRQAHNAKPMPTISTRFDGINHWPKHTDSKFAQRCRNAAAIPGPAFVAESAMCSCAWVQQKTAFMSFIWRSEKLNLCNTDRASSKALINPTVCKLFIRFLTRSHLICCG